MINRGLKDKERGKVAFKREETASLKTKHGSPWLARRMAADQVTVRGQPWLEIHWRGRCGLACCIEKNRLSLTCNGVSGDFSAKKTMVV